MDITDISDEEKRWLHAISAHLVHKGELVVEKLPDGSQKWSFPRVSAYASGPARYARAVLTFNFVEGIRTIKKVNHDNLGKDTITPLKEDMKDRERIGIVKGKDIRKTITSFVNEDDPFPEVEASTETVEQDEKVTDLIPSRHSGSDSDPFPQGGEKLKQSDLFGKPGKSMRVDVMTFIGYWHSKFWLPKMRCTDRQCSEIHKALQRPMFAENYKECLDEILKSKFLKGGAGRGFKFSLDWFLVPDNFDKMLEGKYRDKEKNQATDYDRDTI